MRREQRWGQSGSRSSESQLPRPAPPALEQRPSNHPRFRKPKKKKKKSPAFRGDGREHTSELTMSWTDRLGLTGSMSLGVWHHVGAQVIQRSNVYLAQIPGVLLLCRAWPRVGWAGLLLRTKGKQARQDWLLFIRRQSFRNQGAIKN